MTIICYNVKSELVVHVILFYFFFQAEDGIRDLVRSRGLGDVYKRQVMIQLFVRWLLETKHLAPLRIDARHNMLDRTILALSLIHI